MVSTGMSKKSYESFCEKRDSDTAAHSNSADLLAVQPLKRAAQFEFWGGEAGPISKCQPRRGGIN
jgi:hypothetical protein